MISNYSQTSCKQTPLGPSIAVHLWEVFAYERLKIQNTVGGRVWQSNLLISGLVHVNILVNVQKCKIIPQMSLLKSLVDFKNSKLSQLGHFL